MRSPAPTRRAITGEERNYLIRQRLKSLSAHAILILFGIAFMLPFVWMVSSSVKPNVDIFELPVRLIPKTLRIENYIDATNAIPFCSTCGTRPITRYSPPSARFVQHLHRLRVLAGALAGANVVFIIVIATMMLPFQVRMIPLYILFARIGWLNSFLR